MARERVYSSSDFLLLILVFSVISLTPKAIAQDGITGGKKFAPSGIDWNTLCTDLSHMNLLSQKCTQLINSNGTLTPIGTTTMECIKSVLSFGLSANHRGTPLSSAVYGLGLLAQSTGCGNEVNMSPIESPNQFKLLLQTFNLH
jgi:hypothetical protein